MTLDERLNTMAAITSTLPPGEFLAAVSRRRRVRAARGLCAVGVLCAAGAVLVAQFIQRGEGPQRILADDAAPLPQGQQLRDAIPSLSLDLSDLPAPGRVETGELPVSAGFAYRSGLFERWLTQ